MKIVKNNYTLTRIACYTGYFVQAIINNLAALFYVTFQTEFEFSYSQISWLILLNFVTQIFIDVLSVKIISVFGYRKSAVLAHLFSTVGLIMLGTLPVFLPGPFISIAFSVMVYACGSGLIEVIISPIIEALPFKNKSGEMSLLHSFYCWGQTAVVLFTTLLIKCIGIGKWNFAPVLWAVVPFLNMFVFSKAHVEAPEGDGKNGLTVRELISSGLFIKTAAVMLCSGASEIAMSQWASEFAEKVIGVNKAAGDIFGPCLFALLMAAGRVVFGIVGDRINCNNVLFLGSVLCICSYLMVTLSNNPFVSFAGFGLCGLSVSVMWPGTLSLASRRFPLGGTALFALLAMFGDIGCAFGPWIAGIVSDLAVKYGFDLLEPLKSGLLICLIFPLIIFIITLPSDRKTNKV